MRETEPTPVTETSKSYLAWRIFRYLSIQGCQTPVAFLTWWLAGFQTAKGDYRDRPPHVRAHTQLYKPCQDKQVRVVCLEKVE